MPEAPDAEDKENGEPAAKTDAEKEKEAAEEELIKNTTTRFLDSTEKTADWCAT